jgi:2-deoxy-D-gluconate 3-dehydrogenase
VPDTLSSLFSLEGQVALVTGAGRGLGAAAAVALARAGARVLLHASREPATATADAIVTSGGTVLDLFTADLASRSETNQLIADVSARAGRLDVLVNNAGIIRRQAAEQYADEDWDDVLEVNLSAAFRLCRGFGRAMLARGRGKIINVSSLLAFQGGIRVPAYAAAKGGLAQLTKALANEWAPHGVHVNAIAPGYMATDNTQPLRQDADRAAQILARIPAGRWGTPEDLDGAFVYLASRASDYVHGHVLVVDGGWLGR